MRRVEEASPRAGSAAARPWSGRSEEAAELAQDISGFGHFGRSLSPSQPPIRAEPERIRKRTVPISSPTSEEVCPFLSRRIERSQSEPRKGLSPSHAGPRKKSVPISADGSSGAKETQEKDCPHLTPDIGRSPSPSQPTVRAEPERPKKMTVPISVPISSLASKSVCLLFGREASRFLRV